MSLPRLKSALKSLLGVSTRTMDRDISPGPAGSVPPPLAAGRRSVTVGTAARHGVIITGDRNVVQIGIPETTSDTGSLAASLLSIHQLPPDIADFEGREEQVSRLLGLLEQEGGRAAITAIVGMGGIGKTVLVAHVGHRLTGRYPHGQLFVEMEGNSEEPVRPAAAMATIIRSFDPVAQLPESEKELQPIYRSILEGKQVLLVFDNAKDSAQVEPLMPPGTSGVIITSRRRVIVPGVTHVDLDVMKESEAVSLLRSIVGDTRASDSQLAEIASLCGYLPLALRMAGTFVRLNVLWDAYDYITALADERRRLGQLAVEGTASLDVTASLSLSVAQLWKERADLAGRWHALGIFPSGFALEAAADVWEQPFSEARDAMTGLVARSMVLFDEGSERFRLHDLMRILALGMARGAQWQDETVLQGDLERARTRHALHYFGVLEHCTKLYMQGHDKIISGLSLYDLERHNIDQAQVWAEKESVTNPVAARCLAVFPSTAAPVFALRFSAHEWSHWLQLAKDSAREVGDRHAELHALNNLGVASTHNGEYERAIELYGEALRGVREIGDRHSEALVLGNLANAYDSLGESQLAIDLYEEVLAVASELGDRRTEGYASDNLGRALANLGETRRAIECHSQALDMLREVGDRRAEANALYHIGSEHLADGEARMAAERSEQAIVISREIGDRRLEGASLGCLGSSLYSLGEYDRAVTAYQSALQVSRALESRADEGTTLYNIGIAYHALRDYGRAVKLYEQALSIYEEIQSPKASEIRRLIASLAVVAETESI